jgi:hypothetical protein
MERPEQLATIGAAEANTTTTSTEQPMVQTTMVEEPTTSKEAGNVANPRVPEQIPE